MKEDDYDVAARRPSQYYHDRYGEEKHRRVIMGFLPHTDAETQRKKWEEEETVESGRHKKRNELAECHLGHLWIQRTGETELTSARSQRGPPLNGSVSLHCRNKNKKEKENVGPGALLTLHSKNLLRRSEERGVCRPLPLCEEQSRTHLSVILLDPREVAVFRT